MGFFSNLKNAVTGGAASVALLPVSPVRRGEMIEFEVEVRANADAKVNAVYILLRAREHAQLRDTDHQGGKTTTETVHGTRISFEHKLTLAGPQQLQTGHSYRWKGMFEVPAHGNPSFSGHMIGHTWEVQAGLDMTGNDPDSGWQPLVVM